MEQTYGGDTMWRCGQIEGNASSRQGTPRVLATSSLRTFPPHLHWKPPDQDFKPLAPGAAREPSSLD